MNKPSKVKYVVSKIYEDAEKGHTTVKKLLAAKAGLSIGLITVTLSQHPAAIAVGITANMVWLWLM